LAAYDPAHVAPTESPARLRWSAIEVQGRPRSIDTPLELSETDDLRVEFRLLDFAREHAIRYRVQLEGLQAQPGPWRPDNAVRYEFLPAGRYTFRVWAQSGEGLEVGPESFPLTVVPPAWRGPWALAGYALVLVLLGLGLGRWRMRLVAARARALEQTVAARTAELAEANRRLEQAAVTDPLTGLKNRRYFSLMAHDEAERTLRRVTHGEIESDLLVVMLDVDHFKRINDRYGHPGGDAVLVELAARLRRLCRESDAVLRWGGEEFLLLLRDTERDRSEAVLRRLLDGLSGAPVAWQEHRIRISVSIGAIAFPPLLARPRAHTLEQCIELADAALYEAKQAGRDRAVLWAEQGEQDGVTSGLRRRVLIRCST
jgi:diguanylate cyclase (GGDEF)-like protein